jgi:hypothetical protein
VLEVPGRRHPGGIVGGDLDQIVAEREWLSPDRRSFLVDQVEELLGVAAHGPGGHGLYDRCHPEQAHDKYDEGRQARLRGAAFVRSGAGATTVDCHYRKASADLHIA